MSFTVENLSQRALASWMADGGFERHLRRSNVVFRERLKHTVSLLEEHKQYLVEVGSKLDLSYNLLPGGTAIWLGLNIDCNQLAKSAYERKILIHDQSHFTDEEETISRHVRLGFGRQGKDQQAEGIKKLLATAAEIKKSE
jgi:DNA-binding transcriptional MocR family regulator